MRLWGERSDRQRAAIDAVAAVMLAPAKLFELVAGALVILAMAALVYELGAVAWSLI